MSYNDNRDSGGVVISNDVIASIAANAVKDVDGFGSFSSRSEYDRQGCKQGECLRTRR